MQRARCRRLTVERAVERLRAEGPSRVSVGAICSDLGLSNKHLVQQFRQVVGVPSKVLARVLRFQAVLAACSTLPEVAWSSMAYDFGFTDQSHLTREFRRLGSVTPSQFLALRNADSSAVIVE